MTSISDPLAVGRPNTFPPGMQMVVPQIRFWSRDNYMEWVSEG